MDEEEAYDSDELEPEKPNENVHCEPNTNQIPQKMSWLLQISLENLGVIVNPLKVIDSFYCKESFDYKR